jgi:small subunit ribosomal protein S6
MPQYECAVVLNAALSDEQLQEQIEQVKGWIAATGADLADPPDIWGRKRLAYPIGKQTDGFYVIYYFALGEAAAQLRELDRRLINAEAILRHLVVRLPALKEMPRIPKEEEGGEPEAARAAEGTEEKPAEQAEEPAESPPAEKPAEPASELQEETPAEKPAEPASELQEETPAETAARPPAEESQEETASTEADTNTQPAPPQ